MLYHRRKQLLAKQVLILSPNPIFSEYISHILPELGEENILEMTLDLYAYRELKQYKDTEDKYDYLEHLLCLPEDLAEEYQSVVSEKQSKEYKHAVLGDAPRLSVEASNPFGWERFADKCMGINHFGTSGPAEKVFEKAGLTVQNVVQTVIDMLKN